MTKPIHHDLPLDLASAPVASPSPLGRAHPPVRWDVIHRVRREIARGEYETADKWLVVLERLAERGVA